MNKEKVLKELAEKLKRGEAVGKATEFFKVASELSVHGIAEYVGWDNAVIINNWVNSLL